MENNTFEDPNMQMAYNKAAAYGDTETAKRFLTGYEVAEMPLEVYERAFDSAYSAGRNSRALDGAGRMLNPAAREIAINAGKNFTIKQESRLETPTEVSDTIRQRVMAMPTEATSDYTGVVLQNKTTRMTNT